MDGLAGYDLEGILGAGAMGAVVRARQRASGGRVVAIKRLRGGGGADLVARLRREGEVLAALDHPHIVRVFELLADGEGLAIVMQYAAGGSLAELLRAEGARSPAETVGIVAPIADALASAHRRGVLHRDVKPGNILFTSDGEPLLSDFGTARWLAEGSHTAPGATWHTAEYLDPEVAAGGQADARSDLYSLGVVSYELLTGRRPFTGSGPLATMRAADEGTPPPLAGLVADLPPALAATVERALARRPADRHPSADAFAAALRTSLGPTVMPALPRPRRASPGHAASPGPRPDPEARAEHDDATPEGPPDPDGLISAPPDRADSTGRDGGSGRGGGGVRGPWGEVAGLLGRLEPEAAGEPSATTPGGPGPQGGGRGDGPPTRQFGPRPPRSEPAARSVPTAVPWRWVVPLAIVLLVVPVAAVALLQSRRAEPAAPGAADGTSAAVPSSTPGAGATPGGAAGAPSPSSDGPAGCAVVEVPAAGVDEVVLEGDLDGSGCRSWVRWRGNVADVALDPGAPPRVYEVGVPGDALVLGDWDCDGSDTPGLYRPSTGEVYLFDDWAAADEPLRSGPARDSGVRDGTPAVVADGACDRLDIAAP